MNSQPTNQTAADDFPPRSWLLVEVKPGDVPKSVRMRAALKCLLRSYGIRVVKVSGQVPNVERGEEATNETRQ